MKFSAREMRNISESGPFAGPSGGKWKESLAVYFYDVLEVWIVFLFIRGLLCM